MLNCKLYKISNILKITPVDVATAYLFSLVKPKNYENLFLKFQNYKNSFAKILKCENPLETLECKYIKELQIITIHLQNSKMRKCIRETQQTKIYSRNP